jgi:hypothetical protein
MLERGCEREVLTQPRGEQMCYLLSCGVTYSGRGSVNSLHDNRVKLVYCYRLVVNKEASASNPCNLMGYLVGYFKDAVLTEGEPGSSVRIVSDYELNDRAIEVRSPAGA